MAGGTISPPILRAASNIVVPGATSTGIPSMVTLKFCISSAITFRLNWKILPLPVLRDLHSAPIHNCVLQLLGGEEYAIQTHRENVE